MKILNMIKQLLEHYEQNGNIEVGQQTYDHCSREYIEPFTDMYIDDENYEEKYLVIY
jgi:hypothetical protein